MILLNIPFALVAVGLCIAILTWFAPAAGLAMIGQAYLVRSAFSASTEAPTESIFTVLLVLTVFMVILVRERATLPRLKIEPLDVLIAALLLVHILGVAYSPDPERGIGIVLRLAILGVSFYYISRLVFASPRFQRDRNIHLFIAATWLLGVVLATRSVTSGAAASATRLTIGNAHPIPFSMLLAITLLISLFWLLGFGCPSRLLRVASGVGLPLILYAFLHTNTRGTAISLLITVLAMSAMIARRGIPIRSMSRIGIGALILTATIVLFISTYPSASRGLTDRLAVTGIDQSSRDRTKSYGEALVNFRESPLLGNGTASFATEGTLGYVHSITLEMAAEHGILGLVVLGSILLLLLDRARKTVTGGDDDFSGILCVALVVLFFSEAQVSFTLWHQKGLFCAMGMVVSLTAVSRVKVALAEPPVFRGSPA